MVSIRSREILALFTLLLFLIPCRAHPQSVTSGAMPELSSQKQESRQANTAVSDWFAKYDRIRCDAEMTAGEKMQAMHLNAAKPQKKNGELASRMLAKYTIALSAMKQLPPIPETRELQERYTEYFSKASKLFSEFVDAQTKVPYPSESLSARRKDLEVFDRSNKTLDRVLRAKYSIGKHKHI